jgi:hypothetical protein
LDIIENIKAFRKSQKGRYVSTTHVMEKADYKKVAPLLLTHFDEFRVQNIKYGRNIGKVELTIIN